ncbi:MAG: AAA family ATPase [Lachnospiraceae bacterium]|nr:AAA family ATPase [Lachnospiraceae bacterium]
MIISVAIADKNRDYASRLSEVLQQYDNLDISVFTSAEKLEQALETNRYDIVLLDPDISAERLYLSNVRMTVCLYSEEAVNTALYADALMVSKYQRVSNIYKEMIKKFSEIAGYVPELGGNQVTRMIGVYSPAGGSGKTIVALAIAARMASLGKKVLYLSCEQLYSPEKIFPYREEGNTELVAALDGGAVFELKLQGLVKSGSNNVSYIEGFQRIVDYCDVDYEEMSAILKNIRKTGLFDEVVMDMGSTVDTLTKAVIAESDKLVIVNRPGTFAARKMELFSRQALIAENQAKLFLVNNFMESNTKVAVDLQAVTIGTVHHYGNLAEESVIQAINMNKEIDVSQLMQ